ncbi:GCN5-like N-acetyltransferase [Chytridium lagenaria]|nr:GCN5-like N-acetyltransferase [Chytridium lagenaria]
MANINIRRAVEADVTTIFNFIRDLAVYEKLEKDHVGTTDDLRRTLFGAKPFAEVIIASVDGHGDVGFALYFFNYSTFLSKPGLYLEDLYVRDTVRGKGVGKALLKQLAKIAVENNCGRMEWAALTWNTPAIDFYKSIGAVINDGWYPFRLTEDKIALFGGIVKS